MGQEVAPRRGSSSSLTHQGVVLGAPLLDGGFSDVLSSTVGDAISHERGGNQSRSVASVQSLADRVPEGDDPSGLAGEPWVSAADCCDQSLLSQRQGDAAFIHLSRERLAVAGMVFLRDDLRIRGRLPTSGTWRILTKDGVQAPHRVDRPGQYEEPDDDADPDGCGPPIRLGGAVLIDHARSLPSGAVVQARHTHRPLNDWKWAITPRPASSHRSQQRLWHR